MGDEAEFLAPTINTGLIVLVSPDRRYKRLRDVNGTTGARLVKVPLDESGMPVVPRVFAAHSGPPVPAYLAVGNDDQLQWPALSLTTGDRLGILTGTVAAVAGLVIAAFGVWMVTR